MVDFLIVCAATFIGALFFGMSLDAPKRVLFIAGALGMVGYALYSETVKYGWSEYAAVFLGTLVTCVLAELFARIIKTPATVIIFVSIVPLVPGIMLYKTMLSFANNDFLNGGYQLTRTLVYAGSMAIAVTVSTMTGKYIFTPLFRYLTKRKNRGAPPQTSQEDGTA